MKESDLEYQIGILAPQPGEVVVVKCHEKMTREQYKHISSVMQEIYKGRCLIVGPEMDLLVMAAPREEAKV